jgi:hypothetical protein
MKLIEEDILEIYKKFYRGKENAITREMFYFRYVPSVFYTGRRNFRNIYSQLPIVTCDKGGFYPVRKEEILEYRDYLRKKAIPLFERFRRVCDAHPGLAGDEEQLDLFEAGESYDK